MRQFIRHPVDVPVEIDIEQDATWGAGQGRTHDVSAGGLAPHVAQPVLPGRQVHLSIGYVEPPFHAEAEVAWCRPDGAEGGYELGLSFLDAEVAYLARMVEQLCHIEDYRQSVLRSAGRQLSPEQAAEEWIERYAAQFPEFSASSLH